MLEELARETELGQGLAAPELPIFNSTVLGMLFGEESTAAWYEPPPPPLLAQQQQQFDSSHSGSDDQMFIQDSFATLIELLKLILKALSNILIRSESSCQEDVVSLLLRIAFTCVLPESATIVTSLCSVAELCKYDDVLQFYYSMILNISSRKDF